MYTRYGTIAEFLSHFNKWLQNADSEYKAILDFPGWNRKPSFPHGQPSQSPASLRTALLHPFLPASLIDLPVLAANSLPSGEPDNVRADFLFERRCSDAFRAIGFEVQTFGQGKGRAADCLAIARREGYGVIVDAKARAGGYTLGTEDRKFIEYCKRHVPELTSLGVDRVYLCIVSSSFRDADVEQLRTALADSTVRGFALWSVAHLISVTERSIKDRFKFSLADLESDFFVNTLIAG